MKKLPMRSLVLAAAAVLLVAGCAQTQRAGRQAATVTLAPTTGNSTTGTVRFVQEGDRVQVMGEIRGLKPGAEHGFHVHEKGDCSSGDGLSAGGHFNPGGQPHGRHGPAPHHAGDLPSLRADSAGVAKFSFDSTSIRLGGGGTDIIGRALIVHRDPDDFTTQPTGNSGPRLACGIIVPF
jgi:superoxide dismutase, Cu-Zn family